MSIQVALEHRTTYTFDRPVALSPHVVRLRPAPHTRTPVSAYSLRIKPDEHFLNWQQDPFGNFEARLVFPERTTTLDVVVDLVADMAAINPFDFFLDDDAEHWPFDYDDDLRRDLLPYLTVDKPGPRVAKWLTGVDRSRARSVEHLVAINSRLADDVEYTVRMEPGVQAPEETLRVARGSCRDSAWLLVHILRHLGLAARFVSGYLVQLTPDVTPVDGPAGPTEDFTDLHAWTEVFLPGAGWVGLDPTSGLFAAEGHIPLACTPSPTTAAPISGALEKAEVEMAFSNSVSRLDSEARVTSPYRPEQWASIDALARRIDRRLADGDVRLTMGGEPTFVSVSDMAGPEWNTEADGPAKRHLAASLMAGLRTRFGPGGLVHHGQGKWYPGEALPRWQQALVWRTDGEPVWHDPGLMAAVDEPGSATVATAERLLCEVADRLAVGAASVMAAWEDPLYRLWREATLPTGQAPEIDLDPYDPELVEEVTRRHLTDRLDREAGQPAGWVLPLHRAHPGPRWASSKWTTRRQHLFLLPGDSPLGYRLPIPSLGWGEPLPVFEPSPFARLTPFPGAPPGWTPPGSQHRQGVPLGHEVTVHPGPTGGTAIHPDQIGSGSGSSGHAVADPGPSGPLQLAGPPTALSAEVRNGQLHLFLPPLPDAVSALELVSTIEAVAAELGTPVAIEGYQIPHDPRLHRLVVAPDPGVIEVNVPPARDWDELTSIVDGVHEQTRLIGLGTEKFDLDGTHTGTGGGNHITIGGATPADSPLLRRPSLLRSLVTYWQHHPSLSYVFSGRFIGPSSQSPRVDEGRADNLYELETALAELDDLGDDGPSWMVDRLLRHLLVDETGNTHRAELCIDKLFSPDGERGRLGLLELRAFEMPPHPQMALVQGLLVRALVARCWDDPYRHDLARWGHALHDRFLLPWYLERDLHDVAGDLDDHGIAFDPTWFEPFLEFRFPRHGSVTVGDVTLELRSAIEPWNVLGEEATASGTARYVDSSVERLQLLVTDHVDERYVVACNGVEIPLAPTDTDGTFVSGIRYKAWQPASGLHPTIGIDSPLTFDVVDTWSGRSLGGCRYHVVHPGGLSHVDFPVNAAVAETRRRARFEALGHSPGSMVPATVQPVTHREFPHTLDLRRVGPEDRP